MRRSSEAICQFYKSSRGCKFGTNCRFSHSFSPDISSENKDENEVLSSESVNPASFTKQQLLLEDNQHKGQHESVKQTTVLKKPSTDTYKVCHYFSKYGNCKFGPKCRFVHAYEGQPDESKDDRDAIHYPPVAEARKVKKQTTALKIQFKGRSRPTPVCRFYQAGSCKKGDACKYRHEDKTEEFIEEVARQNNNKEERTNKRVECSITGKGHQINQKEQRKPFISARNVIRELKRESATDEEVSCLRSVEIQQLKKRFSSEKLEVLPKTDDKDKFRLIFSSSDPDWPYDVKLFELEISFPGNYPFQAMEIDLPVEQNLPETVRRFVEVSIQEWIEDREKQDVQRGVINMVFRPFLKWLDKNLEKTVTEGLKQLQRELMAKAAGLEFIPASQLKKEKVKTPAEEVEGESDETGSDSDQEGREFTVYRKDEKEEEVYQGPGENFSSGDEYEYSADQTEKTLDVTETEIRGTEIRLRNLQLRESASTMVFIKIKLVIQCTRCHNRMDLKSPPGQISAVPCQKCNQSQLINFRPSMAHQFSSVIGYLDVEGCTPFDLIMQDSNFKLGCMRCNKETNAQGLPPGQLLEVSCHTCYQKMKVGADSVRFTEISPSFLNEGDANNVPVMKIKKIPKDPRIMLGSPLPYDGTCKHYKKSFRWFRFPCCGKCHPCDVCHEENEDHEMVMANRMICGHCCKEQPFALEKPCVACHQLMTKSRSSHWEGGKGCRDKTKMSRDDVKKYSNVNKTISRKAQAKTKPTKKKDANH